MDKEFFKTSLELRISHFRQPVFDSFYIQQQLLLRDGAIRDAFDHGLTVIGALCRLPASNTVFYELISYDIQFSKHGTSDSEDRVITGSLIVRRRKMLDDISPIGRSGSKIKVTISKTNIMDAPSVQSRKWNWLVADDISMDADLLVGRAQAPRLLVGAQPMFDRQLDTIRHGDVIAICFDDNSP